MSGRMKRQTTASIEQLFPVVQLNQARVEVFRGQRLQTNRSSTPDKQAFAIAGNGRNNGDFIDSGRAKHYSEGFVPACFAGINRACSCLSYHFELLPQLIAVLVDQSKNVVPRLRAEAHLVNMRCAAGVGIVEVPKDFG